MLRRGPDGDRPFHPVVAARIRRESHRRPTGADQAVPLATHVRANADRWTDYLGTPVADTDQRTDPFDRLQPGYDELVETRGSPASTNELHRVVDECYRSLERSGRASFEPVDGRMDVDKWVADGDDATVSADDTAQTRILYRTIETPLPTYYPDRPSGSAETTPPIESV